MTLYALGDARPESHTDTWVAPDANLIGDIVLEEGAIAARGTHTELLQRSDYYAHIAAEQTRQDTDGQREDTSESRRALSV